MATFTSKATGNWSSAGQTTWNETGVPADGDTVIINTGHVVTVDTNTTVGATSGTLNSVDVKGTNSTTFGTLTVASGVTLTLKGTSTTYRALYVRQYGKLIMQAGSTLSVDNATDGVANILIEGILDASAGTSGSPITFTTPSGYHDWTGQVTSTAFPGTTTYWPYDEDLNIACVELSFFRISNSAHTGLGSIGNTSLSFSSQSPATIIQTEVSTLAAVNSAGKYFVDYYRGLVYFYHVYTDGNPSFNAAFYYMKYLAADWHGWTLTAGESTNNKDYNELLFNHCIFEYMGVMTGSVHCSLKVGYKQTPSVTGNHRNFYMTNCTMRFCVGGLMMRYSCTGTQADPILIDSNQFLGNGTAASSDNGSYGSIMINGQATVSAHDYVSITNNYFDTIMAITGYAYGPTASTCSHMTVSGNTGTGLTNIWYDTNPPLSLQPDAVWSGNDFDGIGMANLNCRGMCDVGGTVGHTATITGNSIKHFQLAFSVNNYVTMQKNLLTHCYRLVMNGGSGYRGYSTGIVFQNNLVVGKGTFGPSPSYSTYNNWGFIALYIPSVGYALWADNWIITNNTFAINTTNNEYYGALCMPTGAGRSASFATRCVFENNIIYGGKYAFWKGSTLSTSKMTGVIASVAYNDIYGQVTGPQLGWASDKFSSRFLLSGANYNFATRNLTGIEIGNPTYTSNQTGKNLALTVTNIQSDVTLTWGGGTAKQLVWQGSTAFSAGFTAANENTSWNTYNSYLLTDTAWSWPNTDYTNANCPIGKWIYIVDGAAAGSWGIILCHGITTASATRLSIVYKSEWAALPAIGDHFIIYEGAVDLKDSGGTDGLTASIDWTLAPTTTQSDSVTFSIDESKYTNPSFVSAGSLTPTDLKVNGGSPVIDAGTTINAPTDDYWGTARSSPDIGFYEYESSGSATPITKNFLEIFHAG